MAAPKEVQIITLRNTMQPIWKWKVAPNREPESFNIMVEFVGKKQKYPLTAVKACSIKTYKLTGKICILSLNSSKDLLQQNLQANR